MSIGADYERLDIVGRKIPRGLHNAELSLVAVPGIPEANIQIVEKLAEQSAEPIAAGEYILGFYQDLDAFLPEHFSTVWLDRENGVFAIMGKPKAEPDTSRVQSIFFAKNKLWDQQKIRDWLAMHPAYMTPVKASTTTSGTSIGGVLAESVFVKRDGHTVPVDVVVKMLKDVLPSPMVERSWGFGPQRMCQELRRVIYKLEKFGVSMGVGQDELAETKTGMIKGA